MYNLNSHYENIFHSLSNIVTYPRLIYLHPHGSVSPDNIERLSVDLDILHSSLYDELRPTNLKESPLFVFYDQEPILDRFNFELFDYIKENYLGPIILITTEKNSNTLDLIKEKYNWELVYYFHHVFAAHDWFRGVHFDSRLIPPSKRKIKKKYIAFNRITSNLRIYRSLFISELVKRNLTDKGYVSYNDVCPDNGKDYTENISDAVKEKLITQEIATEVLNNIKQAPLPLRIDYKDEKLIPNHSFVLSAISETQESFVYVVTETCYWEKKCHLTEKIFKPIVSKMPFILVGPAHNLEYLRSYGFKTFDYWWDESYDEIEDPIERMTEIGKLLERICKLSNKDLEFELQEMQSILDYNYNLFYSQKFIGDCWDELITGLNDVCNRELIVPKLQETIDQYFAKLP